MKSLITCSIFAFAFLFVYPLHVSAEEEAFSEKVLVTIPFKKLKKAVQTYRRLKREGVDISSNLILEGDLVDSGMSSDVNTLKHGRSCHIGSRRYICEGSNITVIFRSGRSFSYYGSCPC